MILVGPPGCGKMMLAQRMPSILPPMTDDEPLDVTANSIADLLRYFIRFEVSSTI